MCPPCCFDLYRIVRRLKINVSQRVEHSLYVLTLEFGNWFVLTYLEKTKDKPH